MTLPQFLLSLVCWESIGNSNWFIFAILVLYLITTASFLLVRKNRWGAAAVATLLTVAVMAVLSFKKVHPIVIIAISAVVGIVLGYLGLLQ